MNRASAPALVNDDPPVAASQTRVMFVTVIGLVLAASTAGWLGYRQHAKVQTDALPPSSAADRVADAEASSKPINSSEPQGSTVRPPPMSGRPPDTPIKGGASAPPLSWPLWEFRLRLPIPPRNPSLTPPTWRLIGSSFSGGKWSIIVLRQGNTTPEYFSVGQELPGGYRIDSISDEDVTLSQGKHVMVLSYIGNR